MIQKKIGTSLYIYAQDAYEIINDTDATKIFVQNGLGAAFKELNPSLATNISEMNFNIVSVNMPSYKAAILDPYYFKSYNPEDATDEWDEGTCIQTGVVDTENVRFEILVVTSNHSEYVGLKFYVTTAVTTDDDTQYMLYDANGDEAGIKVAVYTSAPDEE